MTSDHTFNWRQKRGRDAEWGVLAPFLRERAPGIFLDVGCGTGYAMAAAEKLGLTVFGIDPELAKYGVRDKSAATVGTKIVTGEAEHLPFANSSFDAIYSSHAIEHFAEIETGLSEIERVLTPGGRAILMIPTGTMAAIRMPALWLFYTHRSVAKFLLRTRSLKGLGEIFLGPAHGTEATYAMQEIKYFSETRWRRLIAKHFVIEDELRPCLYPWPDFPPLFPMMRLKNFSTSIAFICSKRSEDAAT